MEKKKKQNDRSQEILEATKQLLDKGYYYKEINMKEISKITSFSRPSIYNYFQTKEEIFLTLLTNEYESWANEISDFSNSNKNGTGKQFADNLAFSLNNRPLMLKLIANNLTDFEENSRMKFIVTFKKAYGSTIQAVKDGLEIFFPELTSQEQEEFIYSFFPFLYGLNPYAVGTEKQRIGLKEAEVDYTFFSVYELVLNILKKLLDIEGE